MRVGTAVECQEPTSHVGVVTHSCIIGKRYFTFSHIRVLMLILPSV